MTLGDINSKITALTGADTTAYLNADRVIDINVWLQNIVGMILDSQDESDYDDPNHGDFNILTTPLTTNRDYGIPATENVLQIKRVDVSYDGTNYYRAWPLDSGEIEFGLGNDTVTDGYFDKSAPRYDIDSLSLLLYPRASSADVSAGGKIRIEWERAAKDITASDLSTGTVVPGIDYNFHIMLAYGAAYEYCSQNDLKDKASLYKAKIDDYEQRLRRQYGAKEKDRALRMDSFYSDLDFT